MPGPSSLPTRDSGSQPSRANRNTIVAENSYAAPLLWWLVAGTAVMGIILSLLPATGHDQLWFLWAGSRLLEGARLYGPEIMEPNPPMIIWISAAVTALAHTLHLEPTLVFKALQLAALAGIFAFTSRLLRTGAAPHSSRLLRPALLLFFVVAYTVVPARDFGQREHLLSFLTLPYLLLAAVDIRRYPSTPGRIAAAILAGIGFCFKPQQVLVFVTVELLLIVRKRSFSSLRRPEPWIIAAILLIYVALIRIATPEYFTAALPIVRQLYWAVGHLSIWQLIAESPQLQILALLNVAGLAATRNKQCSFLSCLLVAAGLAADAAYLQQGTGWYYQQIPGIVFLLAALFVQVAELVQRRSFRPSRWMLYTSAFLVTLAAILTLHFSGYPLTRDRSFPIGQPDEALFRPLTPGTRVAIISTDVEETMMPVAKYHLFWAQRMNNLWMLPAIFHSEPPGTNPHHLSSGAIAMLDAKQHQFMAEDIQRWKPALVLIERCYDPEVQCQMLEDLHPDLLAWFNRDAAFRAAFASYEKQGARGRFDVYARR